MQVSKNEITKIILEEIRDVLQEQNIQSDNDLQMFLATQGLSNKQEMQVLNTWRNTSGSIANKRFFAMETLARIKQKIQGLKTKKPKKRRRRGARRYSSRVLRNKARRQAKLIRMMNSDKGRAARVKQFGQNYTDEITLKDILICQR